MKTFKHPNTGHGWKCLVCNTSKDEPVVLVGIPGTEDGNNMQAEQVHAECYRLWSKMHGVEVEIDETLIYNDGKSDKG